MVCSPGQPLYGSRYRVERQIGSGSMGIACLATNRQGKLAVLKTLRELIIKSSSPQKFTDRFKDEALRLSLCRHANIISIENSFSAFLKLGTEKIEVPFLVENLEEMVKQWLELHKLNFSPTAPKDKVLSWVGGRLSYFLSRWQ
ncbi:MAG: hypothetical protein LDL47_04195 [Cyanobacteria bacterium KgW148]|nr:hypothetical protein [Cyanobacteria bacterium KgW148]